MGSAVDYSYGRVGGYNSSHLDAVKQAGFEGILRYVSFDGYPKNLNKQEYDYARSIGLGVGVVWETTANMMLRGREGGQSDSYYANSQLDQIGFEGNDLYYASDFDANSSHFVTMGQYLDGCAGRTAQIYGEYDVIEHFVGGGQCTLGWQCAAWSGGGSGSGGSIDGRRLSQHACLFQRVGYVLSNTCDTNDILRGYWGQAGATNPNTPGHPVENPDVIQVPTYPNAFDPMEAMMSGCVVSVNDEGQFILEEGGSIHVVISDDERNFRLLSLTNPKHPLGGDWLELKDDNPNPAVQSAIKFYNEHIKPRMAAGDITHF